jgi:hypothetical protein
MNRALENRRELGKQTEIQPMVRLIEKARRPVVPALDDVERQTGEAQS